MSKKSTGTYVAIIATSVLDLTLGLNGVKAFMYKICNAFLKYCIKYASSSCGNRETFKTDFFIGDQENM